MKEKLNELANLMAELELKNESLVAKKKTYEESILADKEEKSKLEKSILEIKETIKPLAEAQSKELGKKTLPCGIVIKSSKKITYDQGTALKFAKEKDMFLALDKKAFEKVASSLELDWVNTSTVDNVTFPKKLKLED